MKENMMCNDSNKNWNICSNVSESGVFCKSQLVRSLYNNNEL